MRRRTFARVCAAGLAIGALARFAAGAGAWPEAPTDERLRTGLAALHGGAELVTIAHLPDRIATRAALRAADLERLAETRHATISEPAVLARMVRLVVAAKPALERRSPHYDARWELTFTVRDGSRVRVLADAFGRRGAVAGSAVRFLGAPFVARLAALAQLER
ncbi:MAG: hypothetical protein NVSMB19_10410 [Vulcanimicrobiaceae bacterium]